MELLPPEIRCHVCTFLPVDALGRLASVSKEWGKACDSENLWRSVYERDFGVSFPEHSCHPKFEYFIELVQRAIFEKKKSEAISLYKKGTHILKTIGPLRHPFFSALFTDNDELALDFVNITDSQSLTAIGANLSIRSWMEANGFVPMGKIPDFKDADESTPAKIRQLAQDSNIGVWRIRDGGDLVAQAANVLILYALFVGQIAGLRQIIHLK